MDRKPITCGMALVRVIIMRKASSTQAMAMPRVERVTVPDISEMGSARLKAKLTSTMPISIVVGMLIIGSTTRFTFCFFTKKKKNQDKAITLSPRVMAAE